jgi:hypothetical protein
MEPSRRAALLSAPPLWLIGVCLFLPTVRSCDHLVSPAQLLRNDPLLMSGLLSPFLVAEALAIVVIVCLVRGHLGKWLRRAAAALVVLSLSSPALMLLALVVQISHGSASEHLTSDVCAVLAVYAALVGGLAFLWRARRVDGFDRLVKLLAAFTVTTLPSAGLLTLELVEGGPKQVGIGGWGFLGATCALVVIHGFHAWRRRVHVPARASSS